MGIAYPAVTGIRNDHHLPRDIAFLLNHPLRRQTTDLLVRTEYAAYGNVLPDKFTKRFDYSYCIALAVADATSFNTVTLLAFNGEMRWLARSHDVKMHGKDEIMPLPRRNGGIEHLTSIIHRLYRAMHSALYEIVLHEPGGLVHLFRVSRDARNGYKLLKEIHVQRMHRKHSRRGCDKSQCFFHSIFS